jgi:hypothetical protein
MNTPDMLDKFKNQADTSIANQAHAAASKEVNSEKTHEPCDLGFVDGSAPKQTKASEQGSETGAFWAGAGCAADKVRLVTFISPS